MLFSARPDPAPCTELAEATLTVPGEHRKAYLGLYTLVEPVDRAFLKDRFGTDKGLLLRPQGLRGLDYLGDDWEKYRGPYRPLAEPTPDQARCLIAFVRLVQRGEDEQFRNEIASYLDVDKFLRFMAVQALIANADGFFTLAYNYALFLDPNTNRLTIRESTKYVKIASRRRGISCWRILVTANSPPLGRKLSGSRSDRISQLATRRNARCSRQQVVQFWTRRSAGSGGVHMVTKSSKSPVLNSLAMASHIEMWIVGKLIPYARNPRTHSDAQIAQIAASIAEFGFNNSILVDTNAGIIAGHGRLLAAQKLGLEEVPVIVLDHLSEAQKRAYIIADNQLPRSTPAGTTICCAPNWQH